MSRLPVLIVARPPVAEAVGRVLDRAELLHHHAQAADAAESVSAGWAEQIICDRAPGWQALVSRVESVGGAAIVLGPPLLSHERRTVPDEVEVLEALEALPAALERSAQRVMARKEAPAQESLLERARTAELVNRFAQSIATQIDVPEVIREAVARTRDLCDADGASLLLVDPATGELFFDTISGGAGDGMERVRVKSGEGIAGKVAQSASSMLVTDVQLSADFAGKFDALSGFQTGSVIAVPLLLSGDVLGVVEAVRGADRASFQEGHLRRLEALAPHVTIAVHNAQMAARLRESQAAVLRSNHELEVKVRERTQQIGRAKREWEQTFDAIADPIAVQEGYTIIRANLAYSLASGVPLQEIRGRKCYEMFAGRDSPCPSCPLRSSQEERHELRAHNERLYEAAAFHDGDAGGERVVLTYHDVTERHQLASRVREAERLAAIGQLASGAAHEINNPLGFVISNLRGLQDTLLAVREASSPQAVEQEVVDGLEMVTESLDGAERVGRIVRALRELSKLEIGKPEPCEVGASIGRAVRAELGDPLAAAVTHAAKGRAAVAPLQLDQVLGHLLKNAKQATTAAQRISIRTWDEGDDVCIEITDEGCGIPKENLHRVFDPFFSTRGVGGGIGLGLTAAYGIVKRYGGRIEVRSELNQGATFTVRLPRATEVQPSAVSAGETTPDASAARAAGSRSSMASWTTASDP